MLDLNGRTALVTGSTSGIGRAAALALAARGARVLVYGRNERRAAEVVAEIERGAPAYHLTALDGTGPTRDLAAWAASAGDGHVDILVNNVGIALPGATESATEAEFDHTFTINVKALFFLSRPWRRACLIRSGVPGGVVQGLSAGRRGPVRGPSAVQG